MNYQQQLAGAFDAYAKRQRNIFYQITVVVGYFAGRKKNGNHKATMREIAVQCAQADYTKQVKKCECQSHTVQTDEPGNSALILTGSSLPEPYMKQKQTQKSISPVPECYPEASESFVQTDPPLQPEKCVYKHVAAEFAVSALSPPIRLPDAADLEALTSACGIDAISDIMRHLHNMEANGALNFVPASAAGISAACELNILNNLEFHIGSLQGIHISLPKHAFTVNNREHYADLTVAAYVVLMNEWRRIGRV